ncbi:MAG: GTPase ObgE [Planctomycetes bacterium]|nr:GTPase ObgE [Planctomycetota bacterium]
MEFIDEADIVVTGGKGGDGCMSFRREKYIPKGGPDGGDGGRGGHVIFRASHGLNTLPIEMRRGGFSAKKGTPGMGRNCAGRDADDLVVEVPVGAVVADRDTGALVADLTASGQEVVVASGGRGGRGNKSFATATHQTPREYEEGRAGEERRLHVELKLIADVGLAGLPNAGKSTLLRALSAARPKVADYPFTTLRPNLGIIDAGGYRTLVMADIPGLIEGAHRGVGLGVRFLRHIERTKVIVHLIDLCPVDESDPVANYHAIRRELGLYSATLAAKPEVVVGNKIDLPGAPEALARFSKEVGRDVLGLSALKKQNLGPLVGTLVGMVSGPTEGAPYGLDGSIGKGTSEVNP